MLELELEMRQRTPRQGLSGEWRREWGNLRQTRPIPAVIQPQPSPSLQLHPSSTAHHGKVQNQRVLKQRDNSILHRDLVLFMERSEI